MKINKNNYESFFLDFHEGNLNEDLKKELFLFLDENPRLKAAFEGYEVISLAAPETRFPDKRLLKKEFLHPGNYKTLFVAYVEGDLSTEQKEQVNDYIRKNPSLKSELEIYKQAKLLPDDEVLFTDKDVLKRSGKVISYSRPIYRLSIAASIALLLIAYFLVRNNNDSMLANNEIPKIENDVQLPNPQTINRSEVADIDRNDGRKKIEQNKANVASEMQKPQYSVSAQHENKTNKNVPEEVPLSNDRQLSNSLANQDLNERHEIEEYLPKESKSIANTPFKPTVDQLAGVFNDDELKELGVSDNDFPEKKNSLWDLASKSANGLSKVTGRDISISKESNETENKELFTLAIGNFSIAHTKTK